MDPYVKVLDETGNALMIYRGGSLLFSSKSRGIRPHIDAIRALGKVGLRGTLMADKIVGRAAALLMLYSVPAEVHAGVITHRARGVLEKNGVQVYSVMDTDSVKEKDGKIYCPFEAMVQGIDDPNEAYSAVLKKLGDA
jgi:hypothetical protein